MAALTASDIVTVLAFTAFVVANTYTIAQADATFIPDAIVDAKGDLIVASAADTVARLAVGNNGETPIADSVASTGLRYQTGNGLAQGAINGGLDVWQRGTSFSAPNYSADRWYAAGGNATYAQESTTANLPTGFCYGLKMTMSGTDVPYFMQAIETANAIYYAGKRVVLSYYVSSSASSTCNVRLDASTGTDTSVTGTYTQITAVSGYSSTQATTTSMTRVYSVYDVPSDCKTLRIIAGSAVNITSGNTMTITGVQLEVGSVPTTFRRAGGTIQGELAACQRYYYRMTSLGGDAYTHLFQGMGISSTQIRGVIQFPVAMRAVYPTVDYGGSLIGSDGTATLTGGAVTAQGPGQLTTGINLAVTGATQYRPYYVLANNSNSTYIGFSTEL
jgi:hypothetical protein